MRVLVATTRTQGEARGDYAWAVEGELVRVPDDVCDCPDCGCWRGFAGLGSSRATTTALVVDRDLSRDDYHQAMTDGLTRDGFLPSGSSDEGDVGELVAWHLQAASRWPVGTVLGLDRGQLRWRAGPRVER